MVFQQNVQQPQVTEETVETQQDLIYPLNSTSSSQEKITKIFPLEVKTLLAISVLPIMIFSFLSLILFLFFSGYASAGIYLTVSALNANEFKSTQCTIVNTTKAVEHGGLIYYTYTVDYKIENENFQEITDGEVTRKYARGDKVSCYYDITNTKIIRIERGTTKFDYIVGSVMFYALALLFFIPSEFVAIVLLAVSLFGLFLFSRWSPFYKNGMIEFPKTQKRVITENQ